MSLTINTVTTTQTEFTGTKNENSNSIFAGNLSLSNNEKDSILSQKRENAQKQAMKLIGDAWEKDTKTADRITDMEHKKSEKIEELSDLRSKLKDIEHNKAEIQKQYNIDPDSQEQKDLELLEKFQNYKGGSFEETFSKEEIKRLRELQHMQRTEYQNEVLAQNAATGEIKSKIYRNKAGILGMQQSITDARIDQAKSQEMQKATDAADSILEIASDEIKSILVHDGTDYIDEKMKEEQEKVEEAKEMKEEQQERIEEDKDEHKEKETREEQEKILKNAAESDRIERDVSIQQQTTTNVQQAQKNIQKILQENNLVDEDLKGIKIDFNF